MHTVNAQSDTVPYRNLNCKKKQEKILSSKDSSPKKEKFCHHLLTPMLL